MNYRHAFHAGNFADVHKHAVLALILEDLKRKDAPFVYVDTHAGIGAYDLTSVQAEKTGEWRGGIAKIVAAEQKPDEIKPFLAMVETMNPQGGLLRYPGSPMVAAMSVRPVDRLALCELHPEDCAALRRCFSRDDRVGIHHRDGYDALKGLLPPPERRGLVLVDPPFEKRDEFQSMCKGLAQAVARWPTGLYALWHPIKARAAVDRFHADLAMMGLPKTLTVEVMIRAGDDPDRLNGAGLVLVNPPWKLDQALGRLAGWLAHAMGEPGSFGCVRWVVPE